MKKADHYLILTEAELTQLIAACWESGKANAFPFSLGDDGERIVMGAAVVANRDGYASLETRRDTLRRVVEQAFTRGKEFRDGMQQMRANPFGAMMFFMKEQLGVFSDEMRGGSGADRPGA